MIRFKGIIPALPSPFDANDKLNCNAAKDLADKLVAEGVDGFFLCGSTGEWWTLTVEERMRLLEAVMESVAGRIPIMVHVGSTATHFSVALAKHAREVGADAVSALPPVAFSYPREAIWNHLRTIADATDLPLYLYHLPQIYGDAITIDDFVKAIDTMPTLAGVKFSSYRIDDLINLRNQAGDRLNILSGCGEQLLSAMVCGAEGSICSWYNLIPRLAKKIVTCVEENQIEEGRKHEELLVRFGTLCIAKVMGNLKWLISKRGINIGRPRPPILDVTTAEQEALWPKIMESGILEWCI